MKRRTRRLRVLGRVLLVLLVAVVVIHSLALFLLGRRLEGELAAIRARGELASPAELAGPPVPDDQNAAILYAEAFKHVDPSWQRWDALKAYLDPAARREDPAFWRNARQAAVRWRVPLAIAGKAAGRPYCRFRVKWDEGLRADLPHLDGITGLCRLATAAALVAAREGRADEAARLSLLAFRIADAPRDEPSLSSQFTRYACFHTAARGLSETLARVALPPARLEELDRVLAGIDLQLGFTRGVQGELTYVVRLYRSIPALGPEWTFETLGPMQTHTIPSSLPWALIAGHVWRPLLYADELVLLERLRTYAHAVAAPWRLGEAEVEALRSIFSLPPYALVAQRLLLQAAVMSGAESRDCAANTLAGCRVLLSLNAYRARFGEYPETLAQLRGRLGWRLPPDPFSGSDYVYQRVGKGALFYSFGLDLDDDHGRPTAGFHSRVRIPPALVALAPAGSLPQPRRRRLPTDPPPGPRDHLDGDIPWWLAP